MILEGSNGGGQVAQAVSGRALLLKPKLDGLPKADQYHLQILDRAAKRVWQGNFQPAAGALVPEQAPGVYFVELYSIPGALLRNYVMEVKAPQ